MEDEVLFELQLIGLLYFVLAGRKQISDVATPYILHLSFIMPLHIALFSKCI